MPSTLIHEILSFLSLSAALGPISVVASTSSTAYSQTPWSTVSSSLLHTFNTTVDGRLSQGFPFAAPCAMMSNDSSNSTGTTPTCDQIQAGYLDEEFRTNNFGAYTNPQWETCQTTGDQCLLDWRDPKSLAPVLPPNQCKPGSVPSYFIDVESEKDVQAAYDFSRRTEIPLVIKNTGHDYVGRSSAPNSLALWTHNLRNISYSPEFIPEGCTKDEAKPGVTLGAGVQWFEAYAFAEANNITLVGGSDRSVGASGGWLQGGGHSMLSNTMGLGVDRVLQFKVVTPDGQYRIANECQNEDLFFALRGGGGGTFGVVLESTTLASPQTSLHVVVLTLPPNTENSKTGKAGKPHPSQTKQMWSIMIQNGLRWAQEGWGGVASSSAVIYIIPGHLMSKEDAARSMEPLIELGKGVRKDWEAANPNANSTTGPQVVLTDFPSWGTFFDWFASENVASVGVNVALASRLIPKDNFSTSQKQIQLVDNLVNANSMTDNLLFLIDAPSSYPDPNKTTSVTETWRDSIYHVTMISTWNWNSTMEEKKAKYRNVRNAIEGLRRDTPDGAYSNEADVYEPNHEVSFWGANYERLLEIKNKYDPDHLLNCWHCVGWKQELSQYSCYFRDI
ncbi:hypothetical protein D9758_009078 [Tetrapyrgos nigripes]|uniref:FAD-binding PCMH-type domain-containing protein n=1 Tax=Tetrapyrgos nigripes TaxID=182062 RepID=A0A8H5GAC2_9AGAR|nr:hypothetical protein D9758_009078 [Tetrapyrgos nigripes]